MKYTRRLAALLGALALSAVLTAAPVLATEGDLPSGATDMPGETTTLPETGESGTQDPADLPTPEPPPFSEPSTSGSESSSSSEEPWEDPNSSSSSSEEPWEDPNSSSSSEEPWQDPNSSSSSSEEPWQDPNSSSSSEDTTEDPWVGYVEEPTPEPQQPVDPYEGTTDDATPTPRPSSTARPALERPKPSLNGGTTSSSSESEESTEPNYVTFAQLNVRGNSLAATVFYAGVGCIAVGVIGLTLIVIFYIRGRKHARTEGIRDGILEEIHEAENRQRAPMAPPPQDPETASPSAPEDSAPVLPEESPMYTEEFPAYTEDAYPQDGYDQQPYQEEYEDAGSYEDAYPEDAFEQPYEELPEEPDRTPYQPLYQEPAPQDLDSTRQFDTEEILREALRYTEEDDSQS